MTTVYLFSPKTYGHRISLRELKNGKVKVLHKFPNGEKILGIGHSLNEEIVFYIDMGYKLK